MERETSLREYRLCTTGWMEERDASFATLKSTSERAAAGIKSMAMMP